MPINIDYTPLSSNTFITVYWYPITGFANFASPLTSELNAGQNLSKATSWNSFSFKRSASTTTSDPSLADTAEVKDRGIANFGGSMSFYYPANGTLSSDVYAQVAGALSQPRTTGFLAVRIDGSKPTTQAFADGDIVSIYRVETDAQQNNIVGESAFTWSVHFLAQGGCALDVVARTSATAVALSSTTLAPVHPNKTRLTATVNGRPYTNGLQWTTSNASVATVSDAGLVNTIAAGSATITATYVADGANATCTVTAT